MLKLFKNTDPEITEHNYYRLINGILKAIHDDIFIDKSMSETINIDKPLDTLKTVATSFKDGKLYNIISTIQNNISNARTAVHYHKSGEKMTDSAYHTIKELKSEVIAKIK